MTKVFLNLLLINFLFLVLGCNTKKEKIVVGAQPNNCESPTDAIIKFIKSTESDVSESVLGYIESQSIKFSNSEENQVSDWINNFVFSEKRGYSEVKEWNINDNDICFTQHVKIKSTSDSTQVSEVDVKICNSILNKNVSAGNYWEFESKNFRISLKYCFDSLEYIKPVGYYEVVERNGQLERSITTDLRKYKCVVHINLVFWDKHNHSEYNKRILSDNGYLYTDFRNWK
ncbi:hypothetical protein [Winogradskyella poriferorum]|uniref:Lipoprotein n=1 Tax=Winogradskyella poriferorum TaxID=307627 RepID=A0ABU7W8W7_9FLAO